MINRSFDATPEKLESMTAHKGYCHYCNEWLVKMLRDNNGRLNPNACFCLSCGKHYFMEIHNIEDWELEQWKQKAENAS